MRAWVAAALVLLALVGCGGTDPAAAPSRTPSPTPTATAPTPTPSPDGGPTRRPDWRGVDVSHHVGPIDWGRVRAGGFRFAYAKASEGRSYVDPTFTQHLRRARSAGLRVGGYHYFTLCSPGAEQAAHFAATLARVRTTLRPMVDVEPADCDPGRATLLRELRAFLTALDRATGRRAGLYVYPDLEERHRLRQEFSSRRLWVRNLDGRPKGRWWLWQRTDSGRVPGIEVPADINVMRR